MQNTSLHLLSKICRRAIPALVSALVIGAAHYAVAAEAGKPVQAKKTVVLGADEWCPYNCTPGTDKPGYVIEMAKEIFEKKGYQVEYRIIPWEQAKVDALEGRISGAVGIDKNTEGPETEQKFDSSGKKKFQYPANEIAFNVSNFCVLKENPWKFDPQNADASLAQLGGTVGAAEGYEYDLNEKLKEKNMLIEVGGEQPCGKLLVMLLEGKIKACIEDRFVILHKAMKMGFLMRIRDAGTAEEPAPLFIGFCADCGEQAEIFSQGIAELRASGKLAEILSKYGLKDWK